VVSDVIVIIYKFWQKESREILKWLFFKPAQTIEEFFSSGRSGNSGGTEGMQKDMPLFLK